MQTPINSRRTVTLRMALAGLIVILVDALILSLDLYLATDILYTGSFLWRVLGWRIAIFTLLLFILLFSHTTYAIKAYGFSGALPILLGASGIILLKYAVQAFITLAHNSFDLSGFLLYQMPLTLFSILLELAELWTVIFIAFLMLWKKHSPLLPITLPVVLIKLLIRIVGDIDYGAPDSVGEIFYMIAAYTSDILLYGVVLFFGMRMILRFLSRSE